MLSGFFLVFTEEKECVADIFCQYPLKRKNIQWIFYSIAVFSLYRMGGKSPAVTLRTHLVGLCSTIREIEGNSLYRSSETSKKLGHRSPFQGLRGRGGDRISIGYKGALKSLFDAFLHSSQKVTNFTNFTNFTKGRKNFLSFFSNFLLVFI